MSKSIQRILQIVPDLQCGGAEQLLVSLSISLARNGHLVSVASLFGRQGTHLEDALIEAGIEVHFLGKRRGFDPRVTFRLEHVIRSMRPDVIHTHRYVLAYVLPLVCIGSLPPVIHTIHSVCDHGPASVRWLNHIAFSLGVIPVAICEEVQRSIRKCHKIQKMALVPNGIEVERFAAENSARTQVRRELGIPESATVFVSVARLTPVKNHGFLLAGFAKARRSCENAVLLLAGNGECRAQVIQQIRDADLGESVHVLGQRSDVPRLLSASDIFVLTSHYEGNPLSVMEAMASGKPVVSTAVGGVPELVADGSNGLLVPVGDVNSLAAALVKLALSGAERQRMSLNALESARSRFDRRTMVSSYADIYRRVVETRNA